MKVRIVGDLGLMSEPQFSQFTQLKDNYCCVCLIAVQTKKCVGWVALAGAGL